MRLTTPYARCRLLDRHASSLMLLSDPQRSIVQYTCLSNTSCLLGLCACAYEVAVVPKKMAELRGSLEAEQYISTVQQSKSPV